MNFSYRALNDQGKIEKGKIISQSRQDAILKLKNRNLRPIEVKKSIEFNSEIKLSKKRWTYEEVALLSREYYILLSSGISLEMASEILSGEFNDYKGEFLKNICKKLKEGKSLSTCFFEEKNMPKWTGSLIKGAESTGNLNTVFYEISSYYFKRALVKKEIINAFTYPIILFTVFILVLNFLLINVLPKFSDIFRDSGVELPLLTKFIINISSFIKNNIFIIFPLFIISIFLIIYYLLTSKRKFLEKMILKSKIGNLDFLNKFTSTMNLFLKADFNLSEALNYYAKNSEFYIKDKMLDTVRKINGGESISKSLEETKLFPKIYISILKASEESASFKVAFEELDKYYKDELDINLKRFVSLLEPALIIFLSILVGFVVLGVAIPMFDLVNLVR